jgi:hypothetical protein
MSAGTLTLDLGLDRDAPVGRPDRPASYADVPRDVPERRGGPTLDEILTRAWRGVLAHESVACPVCSGEMAPRYGSASQPVGGRCRECGSTLG